MIWSPGPYCKHQDGCRNYWSAVFSQCHVSHSALWPGLDTVLSSMLHRGQLCLLHGGSSSSLLGTGTKVYRTELDAIQSRGTGIPAPVYQAVHVPATMETLETQRWIPLLSISQFGSQSWTLSHLPPSLCLPP